jgi:threonine dehydratase
MSEYLKISDVMQARKRIRPYVKETPLLRAEKLEASCNGAEIWLKLENLQFTGSFKVRGVANKILSLSDEELQRGVTAASSGNHAQAVAFMAQKLGTKAVIVMPENAPVSKVRGAQGYGAEVVLCGFTGEDRDRKCDELVEKYSYSLIHSHIDPLLIAGHGTVAAEIYEQMKGEFDELVIPCGAGSLTSGGAFAMKKLDPEIAVTAVEPAQVPRFTASKNAGKPVTVEMGKTIADGLRVSKTEQINFDMVMDSVDNLLTVNEDEIAAAVPETILKAKILAEPSACVGIAAVLAGKIDTSAGRRICFIISGGNADAALIADLLIHS